MPARSVLPRDVVNALRGRETTDRGVGSMVMVFMQPAVVGGHAG